MNCDFYANREDKIELLDFIFNETDLQIFELSSALSQEITQFKTTDEIVQKFDLENGGQFAANFQLWSPQFKAAIIFKKITLNPKSCDGHTFRYSTEGLGLIQLYFSGTSQNILTRSHIGHQSKKRATVWEDESSKKDKANNWDWIEVEKIGRQLKNQIQKKMAVDKFNSWAILKGAQTAKELGLRFEHEISHKS